MFQIVNTEYEQVIKIKIDPEYSLLVPILSNEEYIRLKESIADIGLYEPIIINQNNILLDGHHRLKAIKELGWGKVNIERKHFENRVSEEIYVIETNVMRRHLNQAQKAIMGEKLEPLYAERAKQRMSEGGKGSSFEQPLITRNEAARAVGLSSITYYRAKTVLKSGNEKIINNFKKGEVKAYTAYKNLEIEKKTEELKSKIPKIPTITDTFDTIIVDPPWPVEKYDQAAFRGGTTYPTLSIEEIKNIKLPTKDNCVLWLWVINRFMHDAYHILETWGFEPKTILTWAKDGIGVGYWLRGQTEHCILAIRGHPVWDLKAQSTLLNAPNLGHSIKPNEFYTLVESLCPGYKLDYYARKPREGWVTYGTMEDSENVG